MGGKTSKSTQAISIPPEVLARYNAINARADVVTNKPFQRYTGEFVAPLTETQRSGIAGTNAAANMAQPYYGVAGQAYGAGLGQGQQYLGEATGYARTGGETVNASDLDAASINKYMSPYLQNVLQGTAGLLNQQNQQQQSGQMGNAIRSGAFGGDRGGIAAANLAQQQNLANAKIFSDILNQGYNTALSTAAGQQAINLSADQANRAAAQATADRMAALGQQGYGQYTATGEKIADLGTTAQGAALAGAGAQLTAGQVEQATKQAENTAKYNEFLMEQSLPYQQLKLAGDIALGTGSASGSTTTTTQPGGFFSDERLKENIKAIGKTFDGQTIHSYNYKGDPRTQIGLIAQEVQKHHPEAVGLAGGYKTVNYDKATEDAADRGHMANGGYASMGGGVMPEHAGQGFAAGGLAGFDPAMMQQLIAAQQAMYEPISKGGMYAGGPNAGGGLVPQSEFTPRQLMTPGELPKQATGAEQAQSIANLGKSVGELGGEVGAWNWGDEDVKKKIPDPLSKKPDTDYTINNAAPTGVAPPAPVDTTAPNPEEFFSKEPGLVFRALGGGIPYSNQISGPALDVPEMEKPAEPNPLMTPGPLEKKKSGLAKAAKVAGTAAKLFAMFGSDKRMKENIKPIGKLFDGQIVHSYNYKGDPRTQIGLIAQEVEDHKPHAVGTIHGMKAVDYAKATSSAAKRGHFAMGGEPEEEMEETPSYEPTGLYHGDNKFVRNLFKATASGNKNIDLMSGEELPEAVAEEAPQVTFAKPAEATGLAAAAKEGLPELLQTKKPKAFAKPTGLAPAMGALPKDIMQIARLIHAGEGTGKNPLSSAKGPYQMIDSTFAGEFRKNYPDRARGMSDAEIIALKRSPEGYAISEAMGPRLIASNAKIVERGGFEPDAGNVYLAHFLGPDTAVKVLRADPSAPISRYVSQEAIAANPPLQKNPTVGGAINWARGYMAKQADRLGRQNRAAGGLAGREGYQDAGAVRPSFANRDFLEKADRELDPNYTPTTDDLASVDANAEGADSWRRVTPEDGAKLLASEGVAPPAAEAAPAPAVEQVQPFKRPEVTIPTGVAGDIAAQAAKTAPAVSALAAGDDNNFFRGLKKGKATSVIPLLSGIAAMGTAPTRSLGVALAAGLGAGAQAAQGQRAFGIKQGELKVAQQLADAKTMEITKGVLEGRYKILSGGMVKDTFTNTFLSPQDALLVRQKAFVSGPIQAYGASSPEGMSREEYEKKYPAPGTAIPKRAATRAYNANPNNAEETILAAAEMTPAVERAWADRNAALDKMRDTERALGEAGLPDAVRTQYNDLYQVYRNQYADSDKAWLDAINNVTAVSREALRTGNAALVNTNANALAPLIDSARTAIDTKQTIRDLLPNIGTGGPLSPITQALGNGLKQLGVDGNLVDNLVRSPDSSQTQDALAAQLRSYGNDPEAREALKAYGTSNFSAVAAKAVLRHAEKEADAKIAAFNSANSLFQANPLRANVPGASVGAQGRSYEESNATVYRSRPAAGALPKGTPYKVLGDPKTYYAQ
jgi:hypothetical protein